jgi:excisionase family DNA binding protein
MRLLTAKQVSAAWHIPLARIYELAREGVLPSVRLGQRQLRFDEHQLQLFIASGGRTTAASAEGQKEGGRQDAV